MVLGVLSASAAGRRGSGRVPGPRSGDEWHFVSSVAGHRTPGCVGTSSGWTVELGEQTSCPRPPERFVPDASRHRVPPCPPRSGRARRRPRAGGVRVHRRTRLDVRAAAHRERGGPERLGSRECLGCSVGIGAGLGSRVRAGIRARLGPRIRSGFAPLASAPASPGGSGATGEVVKVSATNVAFDQKEIEAKAGAAFQIAFTNNDSGRRQHLPGPPSGPAIPAPRRATVSSSAIRADVVGQAVEQQLEALLALTPAEPVGQGRAAPPRRYCGRPRQQLARRAVGLQGARAARAPPARRAVRHGAVNRWAASSGETSGAVRRRRRRAGLQVGHGAEGQPPAAGADGGEQPARAAADQEQHPARRRLLQGLQHGVGGVDVEVVGGVDDGHPIGRRSPAPWRRTPAACGRRPPG